MLTSADVQAWLTPCGLPVADADIRGDAPGEYVTVAVDSSGAQTGGEGQFRAVNFTVTVGAESVTALQQYEGAIEPLLVADHTGYGTWPTVEGKVFFVDYTQGFNGWQRRPIDQSDRHTAQAQFTAHTT